MDSDEEFAEAIEEFLTMYSPDYCYFIEGLIHDSLCFRALLESGVAISSVAQRSKRFSVR